MDIVSVYCDGGVVSKNPSEIAGTWAYCFVGGGRNIIDNTPVVNGLDYGKPVLKIESGIIYSANEKVTNNITEYLAALNALEALPSGWSGNFCSDSQVTLGRLFDDWKNNNLPTRYVSRAREALGKLGTINPVLVDGHPSKKQLAAGKGKRGHHVSLFNVMCDQACGTRSEEAKQIIKDFDALAERLYADSYFHFRLSPDYAIGEHPNYQEIVWINENREKFLPLMLKECSKSDFWVSTLQSYLSPFGTKKLKQIEWMHWGQIKGHIL